jgi:hypothetical protein
MNPRREKGSVKLVKLGKGQMFRSVSSVQHQYGTENGTIDSGALERGCQFQRLPCVRSPQSRTHYNIWTFQEGHFAVIGTVQLWPEMRTRDPLKMPIEESGSKTPLTKRNRNHRYKPTGNLPETVSGRPILFASPLSHQSPGFEPRSIALFQKGNSVPTV